MNVYNDLSSDKKQKKGKKKRYGCIRQDCVHDIYKKRHLVSETLFFYYNEVNIKRYETYQGENS